MFQFENGKNHSVEIFHSGSGFKINQATKQLNNTNRKVETKLNLLPIGPNKII